MEESTTNILEIKPLSKWKRILLFLGDYFVSFILSFILFNLVVFPLAKIMFSTQSQSERAASLQDRALKMLEDDGFLHSPKVTASFEEKVNFTFKVFLSYYAFDEVSPDNKNPQYGHKEENEVVRHYYEIVLNDTQQYVEDFKDVNTDGMFEIGDSIPYISLKNDYKTLLATELMESSDESKYSVAMVNFRDHIFARLFYIKVYNHILENDYVKNNNSFNALNTEARDIMKRLQWVASGASVFSMLASWGVCCILYPLVNKDKRTITMSAMHLNKLHFISLGLIDNKSVMIQSFYHLVLYMSSLPFLSTLFFGLSYSFNLPLLLVLGVISLGLTAISMVIIFVNEYNRSGIDLLTNLVIIPTGEIDSLYASESYGK